MTVDENNKVSGDDLPLEQRKDQDVNCNIDYIENNTLPNDESQARLIVARSRDMILQDNILYMLYQPRGKGSDVIKQLVVPKALQTKILHSYHGSPMTGHQGVDRTFQSIRQNYFWFGMYQDVVMFIKSCVTCQQSKRDYRRHRIPPLQPLPVEDVFSQIHMDFIGPLKEVNGYKHILLIVDSFTKWPECFPLKTQEASEVARVLYDEIICRYGAPLSLVTDRGQNFMSSLITELCKLFEIKKVNTSSYHPQTNAACDVSV